MKYAIIIVSNGNYKIEAEGITDLNNAKVQFHAKCQTYWNAPDVVTACVMIADENLDVVEGHKEHIYHESTPTPTPEPTPESEG